MSHTFYRIGIYLTFELISHLLSRNWCKYVSLILLKRASEMPSIIGHMTNNWNVVEIAAVAAFDECNQYEILIDLRASICTIFCRFLFANIFAHFLRISH